MVSNVFCFFRRRRSLPELESGWQSLKMREGWHHDGPEKVTQAVMSLGVACHRNFSSEKKMSSTPCLSVCVCFSGKRAEVCHPAQNDDLENQNQQPWKRLNGFQTEISPFSATFSKHTAESDWQSSRAQRRGRAILLHSSASRSARITAGSLLSSFDKNFTLQRPRFFRKISGMTLRSRITSVNFMTSEC